MKQKKEGEKNSSLRPQRKRREPESEALENKIGQGAQECRAVMGTVIDGAKGLKRDFAPQICPSI